MIFGIIPCVFITLFISWIFKKAKWKNIYLTYFVSSLIVLLLPILILFLRLLSTGIIDPAALATDKSTIVKFIGGLGI